MFSPTCLGTFFFPSCISYILINYFAAMFLAMLISYAVVSSFTNILKTEFFQLISATNVSTSILVTAALKESTNMILLLSQDLIRLV